MNPSDFQDRYLSALPKDIPAEIAEDVTRFVRYDPSAVSSLPNTNADKVLLVEVGLPRSAAPMLEFRSVETFVQVDGVENTAEIGFDGAGDPIAIDLTNGAIVKYNHDNDMRPIYLAANVVALATCLCSFAECFRMRDEQAFRAGLTDLDPTACAPDSWWMRQLRGW